MPRSIKILTLFTALFLTACASNKPNHPDTAEYFVTNILDDGSKIFSYDITMKHPERRGGSGKVNKPRGRGMGSGMGRKGSESQDSIIAKMEKRMSDKVYKKLEAKLKDTAYCRQGYIEIDSNIGRGHGQIKGECHETANEADRLGFPNL